ncbi:MAG: SEC-C metal-binding domain-containing protein [Butyribacter sp.]|nr:SEC-C metal-binding domain-containing protein [bacterium]MDY3853566.1 SEC-C metal-binding domain-containing protein [Butyribacter sp.]
MNSNVKLEEILNGYKVGELKELAKVAGATGYSKLKKAELVEVVAEQLQSVDVTTLDIADEIKDILVPAKKESAKTEKEEKTEAKPVAAVQPAKSFIRPAGSRKIYPNEPCPCGSGMKYKRCCGRR